MPSRSRTPGAAASADVRLIVECGERRRRFRDKTTVTLSTVSAAVALDSAEAQQKNKFYGSSAATRDGSTGQRYRPRRHAVVPPSHTPPPTALAMTYQTLLLSRSHDNQVETVTLNAPTKLNSLSPEMVEELLHYFQDLENSAFRTASQRAARPLPAPRVVVLKGAGKGFCAGLDLTSSNGDSNVTATFGVSGSASFLTQRRISEIIVRMRRIPQPIIAALHGATCGGGLALALAADVRLCDSTMKANVAMASIGLSGCDIGISYYLPRIVGPTTASEMMLTGRFLTAQRAERVGFVTEVCADLAASTNALCTDMLRLSQAGLSMTKSGINFSLAASSLESQVALEDRQQVVAGFDPEFLQRVKEFAAKSASKKPAASKL